MIRTLTRICPRCKRPVYVKMLDDIIMECIGCCQPRLAEEKTDGIFRASQIGLEFRSQKVVCCMTEQVKFSGIIHCWQAMRMSSKQWKEITP